MGYATEDLGGSGVSPLVGTARNALPNPSRARTWAHAPESAA